MIPPRDAEIRAALQRITASEPFRNAPQLVSFLSFVVDKALAGQHQAIKGYTIATEALGRPEDFDPQADPIVRVEAGRLRRALSAYYAAAGQADSIKITIPRGTYVPQFRREELPSPLIEPPGEPEAPMPAPAEPPAKTDLPEIVTAPDIGPETQSVRTPRIWLTAAALFVLALGLAGLASFLLSGEGARMQGVETSTADALDGRPVVGVTRLEINGAAGDGFSPHVMRSMIIDGLARFDEIVVIDLANGQSMPVDERYILNLRATTGRRDRAVVSRLTHEPSGQIVWSRRFTIGPQPDSSVTAETSISRQIAVSVAQPYGALFADLRTRSNLSDRMRCIVQAYDYWNNPSAAAHALVRECLERLASSQPNAPTVLANLTFFYLDEHRAGLNPRPDPVDRALRAARRGIEIAPESPRTNQALMAALFMVGDIEQALEHGRRALELNPYDTDVMADMGARLVQIGRYDEGADLLRRAAASNPADPAWYDFFLFLAAYMQEDFRAARMAAARITASDYVPGLIAKIAMAAHDRQPIEARELISRMVTIQPEYAVDPAAALAKRNFAPEIQARLLDALRRAGLGA